MSFLAAIGPALGTIGSIIGTVVGAAGTIFSGIAAKRAGDYQNQVAQMNAQIAEENAQRANLTSQEESLEQDRQARGALGELTSSQSASGISLQSRSAIATRRSARQLARLDALNIRQAGDVESYGYRTDAINQKAQGQLAKMQGNSALLGSFLSAGSSLISSARPSGMAPRFMARKRGTNDPWAGLRTTS